MKTENEKSENRWLENGEIKLLRETVQRQRQIISEQKETIASITLENERRTQKLLYSLKNTDRFVNLLARFDDLLTKRGHEKPKTCHEKPENGLRENAMEPILAECGPNEIQIEKIAPEEPNLEIFMTENSDVKQENVQKPLTKPLETIIIEKSIRRNSVREKSLLEKSKDVEMTSTEQSKSNEEKRKKSNIKKSTELEKLNNHKSTELETSTVPKSTESGKSNRPKSSQLEKPNDGKSIELEKSKLNRPMTRKRLKSNEAKQEKSKISPRKVVKAKSKAKKSKMKTKDVTIIDDRILQVEAAAFERENMNVETESDGELVEITLPPKKKRKVNRRFGIKN